MRGVSLFESVIVVTNNSQFGVLTLCSMLKFKMTVKIETLGLGIAAGLTPVNQLLTVF